MDYWSSDAGWRTGSRANLERIGSPGKYGKTLTFSGGQLDLTGSNAGYNALLIVTAAQGTASLQDGGTIPFNSLSTGTVYDFAVSQLSGSVALATKAHVFKRDE
jgi:hypothetical protein